MRDEGYTLLPRSCDYVAKFLFVDLRLKSVMFLFFSCIDVTNDVCVLLKKKVEAPAAMKLQTSPVLLPGPVLRTWGGKPPGGRKRIPWGML